MQSYGNTSTLYTAGQAISYKLFFVLYPIITPHPHPLEASTIVSKELHLWKQHKAPCIFDDATALVGFHPWVLLCAPIDALQCKFPLPWEAHSSFVWGSAGTYETVL